MNLNNFWMAFECLTTPLFDCLHNVFFCFGKKFRCDICNQRFKYKYHLAEHIKYSHSEIFVFVEKFQELETLNTMNIHIKNN
jgi:hypothetical protein